MRKRHISISTVRISRKAKAYVNKVLESNRLSYGPFTEKFEKRFAAISNRKYAMFVNSGTSGLQLALHALKESFNWHDGDEVLVPAITFVATTNVILQNRLKPIFVDVEKDYYCINPQKIEAAITSKTKAIMPVHLFGQSADMNPILQIAKKYKLKVLEDSCETALVKYHNQPVGSLGDISVYSTYIAHIISTGVGGMATTNNHKLATTIKSLMFHGRDNIYLKIEDDDTESKKRLNSLIERRFQFIHIGYSYRNTEMEAAIGLAEIENKSAIIKRRRAVGQSLTKSLSDFAQFFQLPKVRSKAQHIYMLYPIVICDKRIKRDDFLLYLEVNGVETRLFFPLLSQPIYKKLFGNIESRYPVAKKLVARGFIIGSHPYINQKDINYLHNIIEKYLKKKKLH